MAEKCIKNLEYEEQIFNFSSLFFAESFHNFLQTQLDSSIDNLTRNFRDKLINESANPEEFNKGVKEMRSKLKEEYKKSLEMEFQNIKDQMSKFMSIPEHVILKEDSPVKAGLTANIDDVQDEVNDLKGKYKAMLYLKNKIQREFVTADTTIFILDSIINKDKLDFKILDTNKMLSLAKDNLALVNIN